MGECEFEHFDPIFGERSSDLVQARSDMEVEHDIYMIVWVRIMQWIHFSAEVERSESSSFKE
jgi:hypothetical protein